MELVNYMKHVLCVVGTEFFNDIYTNFVLQSAKGL
jgi:hypothetical protein